MVPLASALAPPAQPSASTRWNSFFDRPSCAEIRLLAVGGGSLIRSHISTQNACAMDASLRSEVRTVRETGGGVRWRAPGRTDYNFVCFLHSNHKAGVRRLIVDKGMDTPMDA